MTLITHEVSIRRSLASIVSSGSKSHKSLPMLAFTKSSPSSASTSKITIASTVELPRLPFVFEGSVASKNDAVAQKPQCDCAFNKGENQSSSSNNELTRRPGPELSHPNENSKIQGIQYKTQKYILGQSARLQSDMVIYSDYPDAQNAASTLHDYDFAFVKRSNGVWTFAVLAYRWFSSSEQDEVMVFVVNEAGSTKMIKKKHWGHCIRMIRQDVCNREARQDGPVNAFL